MDQKALFPSDPFPVNLYVTPSSFFPCFFLYFTHSVRRYSICPLIERKSSSAHWASSFQSAAFNRSGTCYLAFYLAFFSSVSIVRSTVCHNISSTANHCLQSAVHLYFRTKQQEGCLPLQLFSLRPTLLLPFHSDVPTPSLPYRLRLPQSSVSHR